MEFEYGSRGSHGKLQRMIFLRTTKEELPRTNDRFHIILKTSSRV